MCKGKIIVIEGLDGSGKETQSNLLMKHIESKGKAIKKIEFPDYSNRSSALVQMYLSGELSENPADIGAYAASSFYAVDRYASFIKFWKEDYENGMMILCDRYTTSNAIYQMTKLSEDKYDEFLNWLWDYEYNKLDLPKPDMVIYLDMHPDVSAKLLSKRYNGDLSKKDIHERNLSFLKECRKTALYTAKKSGWNIIKCYEGDEPLAIDEISGKIIEIVEKEGLF